MKISLLFIVFFSLNISCFSQAEYTAEEFKAYMYKTHIGVKIIYTGTEHSFTIDVVSDDVRTSDQPNFVIVNGVVLQSLIIPFQQKLDFKNLEEETQKSALIGYMNYELNYFKDELKIKYRNEKYKWITINNKLFLMWMFDMPRSNKDIEKQIFLTTICFDHILNLNTPLTREKGDIDFNIEMLNKIAGSLALNDTIIDVSSFSKVLNR